MTSDIITPKKSFFQVFIVKEIIFNDRKNSYEEINFFRNGDITQPLTSVDIEEVFRSEGYNVKILEVFICDFLEFNAFERFVIDMTEKRSANISNSVYGGCIRKDIEESYKCVSHSWMKNEYDDSVIEWFLLKVKLWYNYDKNKR